MRYTLLVVFVVIALGITACQPPPKPDPTLIGDQVNVRTFDYATVKHKSRTLRQGMSKLDVLYLLGRPASETRDKWTYRPTAESQGPGERLIVHFVGGTYIKHAFVNP